MAGTGKEITGTRDTVYDLVSIIYHALQGAETYGMYVADFGRRRPMSSRSMRCEA
jgi:hypothetical protein